MARGGISKNQRPTTRGKQAKQEIEIADPVVLANKQDIRKTKYPVRRGMERAHARLLAGPVPAHGSAREPLEYVVVDLAVWEQHKDSPEPVPYSKLQNA